MSKKKRKVIHENPHNLYCKICSRRFSKYYKTEDEIFEYITLLCVCGNTYCIERKSKPIEQSILC